MKHCLFPKKCRTTTSPANQYLTRLTKVHTLNCSDGISVATQIYRKIPGYQSIQHWFTLYFLRRVIHVNDIK